MADFRIFKWGDVDEYMKFLGGDLLENYCFQKVKLANVGGFSDFLKKNRGRCDRKCRFSKWETALAGTQKCLMKNSGRYDRNVNFQSGKQRLQTQKFKVEF